MKTTSIATVFLVLMGAIAVGIGHRGAVAGEKQSDRSPPSKLVDFQNDIIPLLTKNGCNAGACHGAAIGRGGFKLSLYGSRPDSDFEAITRQINGRRVNPVDPKNSLLVLKPTEQMQHGGGHVIDWDSESATRLIDWIKQGAKADSQRTLNRIDVSPKKFVANAVGESVELKSVAHFSDGTSRDVTKWTIFAAEDPSAVQIEDADSHDAHSRHTAQATILRRGRHVVVARYLNEVVSLQLIVPLTDQSIDTFDHKSDQFIDRQITDTLKTLRLPVSPLASDDAFRRRITLDLTGRLPDPQQVGRPSDRPLDRPLDRHALIDRLLASDEFNQFWTYRLAKLLRIKPPKGDLRGTTAYYRWLEKQVATDASFRDIARALITATGDSHRNGPANFYRTVVGPRQQAEFFSELFMASRLRCANCHDHPLDRWTQDDYHGLSAVFAKVDQGKIVRRKPNGQVIHPQTGLPARPRIPGENFIDQPRRKQTPLDEKTFSDSHIDGRQSLADWITHADNPYFSKAIVNRLWKMMMGRGLVEPVDDFRSTNPATHPKLLNELAEDFAKHGFRLRHTLRTIARSDAYGRSSHRTAQNQDDDRYYSHALRRPLEAEVLADAISDALGVPDQYGDLPAGTRAITLIDPATPSPTLDTLGRCDRQTTCETSPPVGALPQKLSLFNGPLLNARISAKNGRLKKWIAEGKPPEEIVARYYVLALGRHPTDKERAHWNDAIETTFTPQQCNDFLADFVWGILSCEEFTTNH